MFVGAKETPEVPQFTSTPKKEDGQISNPVQGDVNPFVQGENTQFSEIAQQDPNAPALEGDLAFPDVSSQNSENPYATEFNELMLQDLDLNDDPQKLARDVEKELEAVLAFIANIKDEMNQSLINMLEQSLEHARKLQEQNMKHFYEKVLPQQEAMKTAQLKKEVQESGEIQNISRQLNTLQGALQKELQQVFQHMDPDQAQILEGKAQSLQQSLQKLLHVLPKD